MRRLTPGSSNVRREQPVFPYDSPRAKVLPFLRRVGRMLLIETNPTAAIWPRTACGSANPSDSRRIAVQCGSRSISATADSYVSKGRLSRDRGILQLAAQLVPQLHLSWLSLPSGPRVLELGVSSTPSEMAVNIRNQSSSQVRVEAPVLQLASTGNGSLEARLAPPGRLCLSGFMLTDRWSRPGLSDEWLGSLLLTRPCSR